MTCNVSTPASQSSSCMPHPPHPPGGALAVTSRSAAAVPSILVGRLIGPPTAAGLPVRPALPTCLTAVPGSVGGRSRAVLVLAGRRCRRIALGSECPSESEAAAEEFEEEDEEEEMVM